ncbi:antibiotic biosynthesis monooxygenase [Pseudonocardia sp. NPDC049154]|uniref:putative quinol monooxygenase n=1 Tax=Pseudonocardia sp. NPDC049154 TaxID=3155501 RepID=UPI0033DCC8E8
MSALGAIVTIDVPQDRREDLLTLLAEMSRVAREDPGTDAFDVCPESANPARVYLYERYRDREAFAVHRANLRLAELGASLTALASNLEISRITVLDPDVR